MSTVRSKTGAIRAMLEKERSKAQCDRIVRYVGNDPDRFSELIETFFAGPYRVTQYAAWPLSYVVIAHPELVSRHLGKLIRKLGEPGVHDAVKRNILRFLPAVDIPAKYHEKLIELCFGFLTDRNEAVAIQVFAMEVLSKLITPYPELERELAIILEGELPYATPGYRSRALKILRRIKKDR